MKYTHTHTRARAHTHSHTHTHFSTNEKLMAVVGITSTDSVLISGYVYVYFNFGG